MVANTFSAKSISSRGSRKKCEPNITAQYKWWHKNKVCGCWLIWALWAARLPRPPQDGATSPKWVTNINEKKKQNEGLMVIMHADKRTQLLIPLSFPPCAAFSVLCSMRGKRELIEHATNPCNFIRAWWIRKIFVTCWFGRQWSHLMIACRSVAGLV